MAEKLLNLKEVCRYLGLLEEDVRRLVDRGEIPAYRLGGTILRFRKDQIDKIKAKGISEPVKFAQDGVETAEEGRWDRFRDFVYFNDFYIVCAIIIVVLLALIFFY